MNNKIENPKEVETRINARIQGAGTKLGGSSLQVLGVPYDAGSLTVKLQSFLSPYTSTHDADSAASVARKARDAAQPGALEFLDALDRAVEGHYGSSSLELESFGISPRKTRRKLTPEERLAAAQKSRATRAKLREARAQAAAPAPPSGTPPPAKS